MRNISCIQMTGVLKKFPKCGFNAKKSSFPVRGISLSFYRPSNKKKLTKKTFQQTIQMI